MLILLPCSLPSAKQHSEYQLQALTNLPDTVAAVLQSPASAAAAVVELVGCPQAAPKTAAAVVAAEPLFGVQGKAVLHLLLLLLLLRGLQLLLEGYAQKPALQLQNSCLTPCLGGSCCWGPCRDLGHPANTSMSGRHERLQARRAFIH